MRTEVLVVGAGPTGLSLALWLARLGVKLRIIDKTHQSGTTSRALAVQSRTLELYERLGIGFPGGTYQHLFYVADVEASGATVDRQLHVSIDESDFVAVIPLKAERRARLIGTIRAEAESKDNLAWEDVSQGLLARLQ